MYLNAEIIYIGNSIANIYAFRSITVITGNNCHHCPPKVSIADPSSDTNHPDVPPSGRIRMLPVPRHQIHVVGQVRERSAIPESVRIRIANSDAYSTVIRDRPVGSTPESPTAVVVSPSDSPLAPGIRPVAIFLPCAVYKYFPTLVRTCRTVTVRFVRERWRSFTRFRVLRSWYEP